MERDVTTGSTYVSTGHLPSPRQVQRWVDEAHNRFQSVTSGENSQTYPALARVPSGLFGICLVSTGGNVYAAGDAEHEFAIMSVAKPFVFALICQVYGPDKTRESLGVSATGLPFNSLEAVERSADGRTNPMVNTGAIAATSLAPGETTDEKWRFLLDGLSGFAGRTLALDDEVYESASKTNHRNRSIANLLASLGRLHSDTASAVELYTRACSLAVSATDLAVMGACVSDGGVNPRTKARVVDSDVCHYALAVMATSGMYETSGDWLYDVGVPGKSGIGGGIVTVVPGKGGLGTFAPPLDTAGNSVRGQRAARFLARRLGLSLFLSEPQV